MTNNSNTPYLNNGQHTHAGSANQGTNEAQSGKPASSQQSCESSTSYQTRMSAYKANK